MTMKIEITLTDADLKNPFNTKKQGELNVWDDFNMGLNLINRAHSIVHLRNGITTIHKMRKT
jgi:hypothetical protein